MNLLRSLAVAALAATFLSACTTPVRQDVGDVVGGPREPNTVDRRAGGDSTHDPLLDSPHRTLITCVSEQPVTVLMRFKEVRFACKSLGVSATIDEMRDAGWRLLNLDIGEETESANHVGFPVTVTLRKLF